MKFEAMNAKALAAVVNSMRPAQSALVTTGSVSEKARTLKARGELTRHEMTDIGKVVNLSREGVIKVLLSFGGYGVADRVRQAVALVPHEASPLAPATAAPVPTSGPVLVTRVAPLPTLNIVETDGVKTMSSLDMVAYINATRETGQTELLHKNFLAKVPSVLGYEAAAKISATGFYLNGTGSKVARQIYNFPRREAMLMAMSYSYKLQATVYDAWQEADGKLAAAPGADSLGLPTTYLDALKQLVSSVEVVEKQALQIATQAVKIEADAPAVAFHEQYVNAEGRHTFRDVAKMLGVNEVDFRGFLLDRKIQYRNNHGYLPSSIHSAAGRFVVHPVLDRVGVSRMSVYFTPKGVTWITKLWNGRVGLPTNVLTNTP